MNHPSSSCHRDSHASILSPTRNVDAVAEMTEILAELAEAKQLLAEAGGLLPQQAPPGSNPVLIQVAPNTPRACPLHLLARPRVLQPHPETWRRFFATVAAF